MRETPLKIVIPCYNEEHRLQIPLFLHFLQQHPTLFFLFVDDGSRDNTLSCLREMQRQAPQQCAILALTQNRGKAEAVRAGLLQLLDEEAHIVGFWDADLATPLEAIFDLYDLLAKEPRHQIAIGARVLLLGRHVRRNPLRHYLGRSFATLASWLLDLPIYDTQCGAKLFRATPWLHDILTERFVSRWIFDVEIFFRYKALQHRLDLPPLEDILVEHPLQIWKDVAGSKLKPTDALRIQRDLFGIYSDYQKRLRRPLHEIAPHLLASEDSPRFD